MFIADEAIYFARRLDAELNMAWRAQAMEAKLIHLALASGYRRRLAEAEAAESAAQLSDTAGLPQAA